MRHGFHAGRVTFTRETIYLDPEVRPVDLARGSALQKQFNVHFSASQRYIYDLAG